MDFRAVITLFFIWSATAQKPDMVWPKNKATYSDSFLPAVVQVLSYLMERIDAGDAAPKVTDEEPTTPEVEVHVQEQDRPGTAKLFLALPSPPRAGSSEDDESIGVGVGVGVGGHGRGLDGRHDGGLVGGLSGGLARPHLAAQDLRPTVAFILLGRLRDTLAHEAKRQGFSRIQGFSALVLDALAASGEVEGGSLDQLRALLGLMLRSNDIKRRDSLAQAGLIVDHLDKANGPIQKALADVPPLKYTLGISDKTDN